MARGALVDGALQALKTHKSVAVDHEVKQAICQLIQHYPRYGYRRITVMLRRRMGLIVNKKKVQRIMQRNGWTVGRRPRDMLPRLQKKTSVVEGALEDTLIRRFGQGKAASRGLALKSDNDLVFTSKSYFKLVRAYGLRPEYIIPYSSEQNGVIEQFMRTLKEECICLNLFSSFYEAKGIIEAWIQECNIERPHQELGYVSPVEYRYGLPLS